MRVYPRALRLGGSRGRPARLSQAPTPHPSLSELGWRLCLDDHNGTSVASVRASRPKWGQKGPQSLGLGYQRAVGSQTWAPRPEWAAGTASGQGRAARKNSRASGRAGRGQGGSHDAPWPFATGSRAGGRRDTAARPGPGARTSRARRAPLVGCGVPGGCGARAHRRGLRGQGHPRRRRPGTRAAASPPPGPAASFPPPAWRAAVATARAAGGARNGAGLTASPGGGERGSRGARRP